MVEDVATFQFHFPFIVLQVLFEKAIKRQGSSSFPTHVFKILQLIESHKNSNTCAFSKQAHITSMTAAKS